MNGKFATEERRYASGLPRPAVFGRRQDPEAGGDWTLERPRAAKIRLGASLPPSTVRRADRPEAWMMWKPEDVGRWLTETLNLPLYAQAGSRPGSPAARAEILRAPGACEPRAGSCFREGRALEKSRKTPRPLASKGLGMGDLRMEISHPGGGWFGCLQKSLASSGDFCRLNFGAESAANLYDAGARRRR